MFTEEKREEIEQDAPESHPDQPPQEIEEKGGDADATLVSGEHVGGLKTVVEPKPKEAPTVADKLPPPVQETDKAAPTVVVEPLPQSADATIKMSGEAAQPPTGDQGAAKTVASLRLDSDKTVVASRPPADTPSSSGPLPETQLPTQKSELPFGALLERAGIKEPKTQRWVLFGGGAAIVLIGLSCLCLLLVGIIASFT